MDWSIIAIVLQLVFLEGVLSLDNAAILGAMVSRLPEHERIPWPKNLAKIGHLLDKPLGFQRMAALRVGLIGAYGGRTIMLFMASYIIQNPKWVYSNTAQIRPPPVVSFSIHHPAHRR